MLNYGHTDFRYISMDEYETKILIKTNIEHESNIAKSLKAAYDKYDISVGEVISKDRLMAVLLYTDFTNLSCKFSSTFRREYLDESIESIKNRNGNYWWWSKMLYETIQQYGKNRFSGLRGPFYCGLDRVLLVPQFYITLLSPTSTSINIEVAKSFSGDNGIIIEFDNDGGNAAFIRGFDASWISHFHHENES